jgi:hypothetical protein
MAVTANAVIRVFMTILLGKIYLATTREPSRTEASPRVKAAGFNSQDGIFQVQSIVSISAL